MNAEVHEGHEIAGDLPESMTDAATAPHVSSSRSSRFPCNSSLSLFHEKCFLSLPIPPDDYPTADRLTLASYSMGF